jgi:transcriptional regulator with XRE-family HTH domain
VTKFSPALLHRTRTAAGYSRTEVAMALGLAEYTIACWERGHRRPSVDRLGGLADIFSCPVTTFYEREVASCLK